MNLLILTQYFPPEVGAPQNRLFELAVRLNKNNINVSVLSGMPNYPQMEVYENYKGKFFCKEKMEGLDVYRAYIYVTKKRSIVPRLLNYFSFVFTSFFVGLFKVGKTDVILCESPPLFLGISAYLLKKIKGTKLIFNVSDLWPESAEKLGIISNKTLLGVSTKLEEFLYKKSELITGQTQGIVTNISTRFPLKKTYWLPNGVDLNYYNHTLSGNAMKWLTDNGFSETDFILLYAGILGHAQGLEVILNAANELKQYQEIKFVLLGSGPEKEKLLTLSKELNVTSVRFIETVSKKQMPDVLCAVNASIVPLKRIDLFKGAIPSKIFESLAMKKPVLLGVEGEAKDLFIDKGNCGLAFEPENHHELSKQILKLYNNRQLCAELGENALKYVSENFSRDKIAEDFKKLITQEFDTVGK